MDPRKPLIRALPPEAVAQIKSSTVITHLNDVVSELLKNSLDAEAHTVTLAVDFQKGGCTVEDDGFGIPSADFQESGSLGQLYHTSKFNSEDELYGHKGTFLASLAAMALLTITSRHSSCQQSSSMVLHRSKVIARSCPASLQHELRSGPGTRVAVTDLFGNMPVRVKHRAMALQRPEDLDKEWDDLKRSVTALLLAFQKPLKVVVSDAQGLRKFLIRGHPPGSIGVQPRFEHESNLDLDRLLAILSQVGYITPNDFGSWVVASARASDISVQSAISLQPSPTRLVQFLSFGKHPLLLPDANILYDEINRIFGMSSFGTEDYVPENEETINTRSKRNQQTQKEDGGGKIRSRNKGVNRWPKIVVRIDFKSPAMTANTNPLENSLQRILEVVGAMVQQFLEQHQFSQPRSKPSREKVRIISSPNSSTDGTPIARPRSCMAAFPNTVKQSDDRSSTSLPMAEIMAPQTRVATTSNGSDARHVPREYFGSWSRIKSGRRDFFEDICSGLPRGKKITGKHIDRENDNPVFEGKSRASSDSSPPIIQVGHAGSLGTDPGISDAHKCQYQADTDNGYHAPADEVSYWTNPLTKETVAVNKRTGQALPRTKAGSASSLRAGHSVTRSFPNLSVTKPEMSQESSKDDTWLNTVLKGWTNPVFPQTECPLPSANLDFHNTSSGCSLPGSTSRFCSTESIELGFNPSTARVNAKLGKSTLRSAQVISQVDNKFLLIRMATASKGDGFQDILVLVDQHAADERCRVEELFAELCGSSPTHSVDCTQLAEPIFFTAPNQEAKLFEARTEYFASWGCFYSVLKDGRRGYKVRITKLPTLVAERCRLEPKLAIDILRAELWAQHDDDKKASGTQVKPNDKSSAYFTEAAPETYPFMKKTWLQHISRCPKGIVDLLNSRACRTAIMFNDILSHDESRDLISRLAQCAFPFQCAHGRPTMVPIVNIHTPIDDSPAPFSVGDSSLDSVFQAEVKRPVDFFGAFKEWESETKAD